SGRKPVSGHDGQPAQIDGRQHRSQLHTGPGWKQGNIKLTKVVTTLIATRPQAISSSHQNDLGKLSEAPPSSPLGASSPAGSLGVGNQDGEGPRAELAARVQSCRWWRSSGRTNSR